MSTARPAAVPAAGRPPWAALPVLLAGVFMPTLDFFIVNVAVPSVRQGLHAGAAAVQAVIAGYGVAYAAGLVTGGRLGDLYGRRRVFIAGLAAFTLASLGAGLARNSGELIAVRILQGAAAAVVTPQVLAVIGTEFTGRARTPAFNAYGLAVGLAGVFGQLLGGALIDWNPDGLGWRAVFLVNVPVGVLALLCAPRLVPESRGERPGGERPGSGGGPSGGRPGSGRPGSGARLDLPGMLLLGAGLTAVVLPLVVGRQQGRPAWTWLLLAGSVPLLAAFAAQQRRLARRGGAPLIDPGLFRERAFSAGLATTLVYFLAMGSFFLLLALYLQDGRGLTPLRSGLVFVTVGAGFFATSALAPAVTARLGRQVLAVGALTVGAGYAVTGLTVAHLGSGGSGGTGGSVAALLPGLLLAGLGMGLVTAPLSDTVLARVAPRHAATASGALSTAQEAGGAVGVALVGTVGLERGTPAHDFTLGLELLIGCCLLAAALVQLLPGRGRATRPETSAAAPAVQK
ncbi:MFS transporter [Kitasatospora sp. NPDC057198]|uniref:MFS transporter n=1 Tax=Kitasatospora sp. NPDC057198 TaxID=3346046 RepID=UPI00362593D9